MTRPIYITISRDKPEPLPWSYWVRRAARWWRDYLRFRAMMAFTSLLERVALVHHSQQEYTDLHD